MQPNIKTLTPKKLIGKHIETSFSENRTFELWRNFMPLRKEVQNMIGTELYAVEVYPPLFFDEFNPNTAFQKWAAVEVTSFDAVPDELESLILPGGLYAVFIHKGPASAALQTYQHILDTWLPASEFILDERPHFAVMGDKYKNDDPDSEEELWIPVRRK